MIWAEEENEIRQLENIMNTKGKSCMNCQWSNSDEGEKITTCGHHLQNFTTKSFCGYWTSKNDPKVKAYFERRKKELRAKIDLLEKVIIEKREKHSQSDLIKFGSYLTGHDEETIEQMYNDWKR
jgi:ferritin-like metal-binding protein YciE